MSTQRRNPKTRTTALAALVAACATTAAQAAWTGDWTNTVYTNTANWANGTIDDTFSNSLGAARTALLPEVGAIDYATTANGFAFTYGDAFGLSIIPDTVSPRVVQLNGNILVDVAGISTAQTVTFGTASRALNLDLNGGTRTINLPSSTSSQWSNCDVLAIYGNITNGTLVKDGFGGLTLNNAVSLTTDLNFRKGTIQLSNSGSLQSVASLQLQSMWSRLIMDPGTTSNARLNDSAAVVFRSGAIMQRNGTASAYDETLGPVTLESGKAYLGIDGGVSTGATSLTVTSLTRQNSALLAIGGNATLGSTNKVLVTDAASNTMLANSLVGGGGAAGSTNISIIPWASFIGINSGQQDNSWYSIGKIGAVGGFVTYDSTNGFRPLNTSTEYAATLAAAGSSDNVHLTAAESLAGDQTINALWIDSNTTSTLGISAGQTLTVTSGAVGVTNGSWSIGNTNTGTLAFGNKPAYFTGRSTITVGAAITGSGGIVVGGPATVALNGHNSYTGDTLVNMGTLKTINGADRIPDASNLRVGNDGTLMIGDGTRRDEVAGSLSGRGLVIWGSNTAKSSLTLGTGLTPTQGAVTVGTFIAPGDAEGTMQAGTLTLGNSSYGIDAIFASGSSLKIDLASATQCDLLAIANGAATINGGTIDLSLLGGYVPQAGDKFDVLTATGGITGTFDLVNNSQYKFVQSIVNGGNTLELQLALTGPTEWKTAVSGNWSEAANWTGGKPTATTPGKLGTLPGGGVEITLDEAAQASALTVDTSGTYTLAASDTFRSMTVNGPLDIQQGTLALKNQALLRSNGLTIASGAKLDINDSKVIVHSGGVTDIEALVAAGRNVAAGGIGDGSWDGTHGITSTAAAVAFKDEGIESKAVGLGVSGQMPLGDPTVPGTSTPVFTGAQDGDVLLRCTYNGDATLDGVVDDFDVIVVGALYDAGASTGHHWYEGDFNGDGKIDDSDVILLGAFYAPTAPVLSDSSLTQQYGAEFAKAFEAGRALAVPEPATLSLLGVASLGLLARQRRRSR